MKPDDNWMRYQLHKQIFKATIPVIVLTVSLITFLHNKNIDTFIIILCWPQLRREKAELKRTLTQKEKFLRKEENEKNEMKQNLKRVEKENKGLVEKLQMAETEK